MRAAAGVVVTPGRRMRECGMVLAVVLAMVITGFWVDGGIPAFSTAWAQPLNPQSPGVVIAGKVTANMGTSLQINQLKVYPLLPHAKLTDEEGHVLELEAKDLEPGFNVKLHLTDGSIDQIVVLFPN